MKDTRSLFQMAPVIASRLLFKRIKLTDTGHCSIFESIAVQHEGQPNREQGRAFACASSDQGTPRALALQPPDPLGAEGRLVGVGEHSI
jgi:hypothetical protein